MICSNNRTGCTPLPPNWRASAPRTVVLRYIPTAGSLLTDTSQLTLVRQTHRHAKRLLSRRVADLRVYFWCVAGVSLAGVLGGVGFLLGNRRWLGDSRDGHLRRNFGGLAKLWGLTIGGVSLAVGGFRLGSRWGSLEDKRDREEIEGAQRRYVQSVRRG